MPVALGTKVKVGFVLSVENSVVKCPLVVVSAHADGLFPPPDVTVMVLLPVIEPTVAVTV